MFKKLCSLLWIIPCVHAYPQHDANEAYKAYYENINDLMRIDAYTYFNNQIVKEIINSKISTGKSKWIIEGKYRSGICKEIPRAIKTILDKKDVQEVIYFDGTDIKDYTCANYNALVLYNAINVILHIYDPKFDLLNKELNAISEKNNANYEQTKIVLDYTKKLLETHFHDIDKTLLEKSIKDITEYDKSLNIAIYIANIREYLRRNEKYKEGPKPTKITPKQQKNHWNVIRLEYENFIYTIMKIANGDQIAEYDITLYINNGKLYISKHDFEQYIKETNYYADKRIREYKDMILQTMLSCKHCKKCKICKSWKKDYNEMSWNDKIRYEDLVEKYMKKEEYPKGKYRTYFTLYDFTVKRALQEIMQDLDIQCF